MEEQVIALDNLDAVGIRDGLATGTRDIQVLVRDAPQFKPQGL